MSAVKTLIGAKDQAEALPHTPWSSIPATNVWDAIKYVFTTGSAALAAHLADTSDAHDASAISFAPVGSIAATDTQAAVAEVASEAATATATVVSNLAAHIADATDAHAASAITNTPAGAIAATTVQAALNELDTEKLPAASYTAADVLAKLLTVDGPSSGLDADLLDGQSSAFYATASGLSDHLADTADAHAGSAITNTPAGNIAATTVQAALNELDSEKSAVGHTHASTAITDFQEAVEDVVGAILGADGSDIDWTYTDGSGTLAGAVKSDAITYAKMQNVSATSRVLGRITSGAGDPEELTGANLGTIMVAAGTAREILTANRTYYVRTDGSDSNNGLANTAGGAFLTGTKAITTVSALDVNGFTVTIQFGAGTRTETLSLKPVVGVASLGSLILRGDTTTPSNCTFNWTSVAAGISAASCGVGWQIEGFKFTTTTSGYHVFASGAGTFVIVTSIDFGAVATGYAHVAARQQAEISLSPNYTISAGGGFAHAFAGEGGLVNLGSGGTVTLSGTPAFTQFVQALGLAGIQVGLVTYSGSATGKRYDALTNSFINTFGQGATFFPGNAAGTTATGGQYA